MIIIGDLHGDLQKFQTFMSYKPETDHLCLGDYVDSFHIQPLEQLQLLQEMEKNFNKCVFIWGNHDLHYLKNYPFKCSGYQHYCWEAYQLFFERNKKRFKAAYYVDGYVCTHAGIPSYCEYNDDPEKQVEHLNTIFARYLRSRVKYKDHDIFAVGRGRGGAKQSGGIFWHDPYREYGLSTRYQQIIGHTERKAPEFIDNFINLDTTNSNACWVFDTATGDLKDLYS